MPWHPPRRHSFRLLLLLPLLLLPAPQATAAHRTETIALRYLSAHELDRMLTASSVVPGVTADDSPDAPATGIRLALAGVVSWTTDPYRNAVTITGEAEALEEVLRLVQLIDVPPRRMRITARVLHLDARAVEALRLPPMPGEEPAPKKKPNDKKKKDPGSSPFVGTSETRSLVLDDRQVALLEQRKDGQTSEFVAYNSRPWRVRWTADGEGSDGFVSLMPRLNRDDSISLKVTLALSRLVESQPVTSVIENTVRTLPGQSVLVITSVPGQALVFRVHELLPPDEPAGT